MEYEGGDEIKLKGKKIRNKKGRLLNNDSKVFLFHNCFFLFFISIIIA